MISFQNKVYKPFTKLYLTKIHKHLVSKFVYQEQSSKNIQPVMKSIS